MDNLFTVFIVIIFILGPIIEGLKKKEQERQRQQQPPKPAEARPRSATEEISARPRETAATMVPDDLWQILTGQQRPAPQVPVPTSTTSKRPWDVVYIPPEETDNEEDLDAEDAALEASRNPRVPVQRDRAPRYNPAEAVSLEITKPNIISLEGPLPSAAARHSAFHEKLDRATPVSPIRHSRKSVLGLATRTELQRAFVLQEILGPPRGLE